MFWRKLNFLVPEPQCNITDDVITDWFDTRSQPNDAAINAVSLTAIETREQSEAFDKGVENFSPSMKALIDQLEDELPGFKGRAKVRHDQITT